MKLFKTIAVVGSREFKNYSQLENTVAGFIESDDDEIRSGGAFGADSMAQRFCKAHGFDLHICYPKYRRHGNGATFKRNKLIVQPADVVLAFYAKGHFQEGGTANSAHWARELDIELHEFEEE